MLLGRQSEREVLDRLLAGAQRGEGSGVVVLGEPGIGKTALLEQAITSAEGFRVLRTAGHEGELELPYAALQQLCAPALDRLEHLPGPQRDALGVVFGLATGDAPDRLLVALAVLTLLSGLAARQPLLCVVDDAQWLDQASAQALAFVARRVETESVAFVLAAREISDEVRGLPELVVEGLGNGDARMLFRSVFPYRIDEAVLDRIVAETHGNPLALLELPRGLTPAQPAGGCGSPVSVPLAGRIEESFRRRLVGLPSLSRRLLLLAAADPTGSAVLVWRAAEILGISPLAAEAVEAEGLLDLKAGVVFRHPPVRSAVYSAASVQERRDVHHVLAEATDPAVDPDRRVWHLAQAALAPNEEVAGRAQARGGFAAAAAFMQRSAELTADPARRAGRALLAAGAKRQAGALEAALGLAALAEPGPLDEFQCADLDVVRAQISFASDRGSDAPSQLLKAAQRLECLDVTRARETYLDALTASLFAGELARGPGPREVALAARAASRSPEPSRPSDLLLDGLSLLITDGPASGTPVLQQALSAFCGESVSAEERQRWSWLAGRAAAFMWDYDSWDLLTARQVEVARDAGALTALPLTLSTRGGGLLFAGRLALATSLLEQVQAVADNRTAPYAALAAAAFRGRENDARHLIGSAIKDFAARGEGMGLSLARWATAVLCNGLGRYQEAFAVASEALQEDPTELWFSPWATVELIEASSRIGQETATRPALERLAAATSASGTDWARAIEARCRALFSRGKAAEDLYCEAIELLTPTTLRLDLARTRLLYGEWLRRGRRPRDAREQLRAADVLFTDFGMEGFAARARAELRATGERARKRTVDTQNDLTPQEARISELVAQGASNPEIAAQLFISPSTVEYHLRKVFTKLGVRSRTQLARVVFESSQPSRRSPET
jgi:DNA-binding CsgD family transcriptional regulator